LKERFDTVIHLAGFTKVDNLITETELFDSNVTGTSAVMHYCRKRGAACVLASSSAVYKPVLSNRRLSEGAALSPSGAYGISKMLAEHICRYFSENEGVPVISLRIFNMYGPGQKSPFLIPYMKDIFARGDKLAVNTPFAVRDYVYVSDVVNALISACARVRRGFAALNVGTGDGHSVEDVARIFARIIGVKPRFVHGKNPPEKDFVVADNTRIRKELGWVSRVNLERGLFLVNEGA